VVSEPSISGAEAATAGFWATAISAPDFTPLGILTGQLSEAIATMYPTLLGVVEVGPGRSVVWPEHRSKNLRTYEY
jgi:hypothetical protein